MNAQHTPSKTRYDAAAAMELADAVKRLRKEKAELLAALQGYESARIRKVIHADASVTIEMDFRNENSADCATGAARAAIAKATGGQP